MITISKEKALEIAKVLDSGEKCFYNFHTGKYLCIPDYDLNPQMIDEEKYQNIISEVEANVSEYMLFEPLSRLETFNTMEAFASSLKDKKFKNALIIALGRKSPLENFELTIKEIDLKDEWAAYRLNEHKKYIKHQVKIASEQHKTWEEEEEIEI